jgi:hypothetical protein
MFQSARKHLRAIAMIGVASALVVGGVAAAQGSSESGSNSESGSHGKKELNVHFGGPPPLGGPAMGDLTYAELHVQKDGKAQTIRLDQGKITAVDDSSISLEENDGNDVTIPVDSDTKVIGKPKLQAASGEAPKGTMGKPQESTVDDLSVGQQVTVTSPDGGTAESIMAMPKKGEMMAAPMGGPMPPPIPLEK